MSDPTMTAFTVDDLRAAIANPHMPPSEKARHQRSLALVEELRVQLREACTLLTALVGSVEADFKLHRGYGGLSAEVTGPAAALEGNLRRAADYLARTTEGTP